MTVQALRPARGARPVPRTTRGMSSPRNIAPPAVSSPVNIVAALLAATIALASGPAGAAAEPTIDTDEAARQLDLSSARLAFAAAQQWVERADVPENPLTVTMNNVVAVHVTLRHNGLTMGQSTVAIADPFGAAEDGQVDVSPMLARAMRNALREAATRVDRPIDLPKLSPLFALDVQLARPPQPIRVERLSDLPQRLTLNLHGLAMRRGVQSAWAFPGTSVAANADLQAQLNRLLGELGEQPDRLAKVGQADGPELYRFETIHLVELEGRREPAQRSAAQ